MFTEPHHVQCNLNVRSLHGCIFCTMKLITLIMSTPKGERAEYNLLTCSRLPKTYLLDLYTLYVGRNGDEATVEATLPLMASLHVETIIEPNEWLDCIKWSRFRQEGHLKSLEIFVSRPFFSQHLYAVGEKGNILVDSDGFTIKIHETTVQILCGESKVYCSNPKIVWVDRRKETTISKVN